MVGYGDELSGDMARELHLYAVGGGATGWYQTYAVAHAKHVSVDSKGGLTPYDGLHYIGCLAPYARQSYKLL